MATETATGPATEVQEVLDTPVEAAPESKAPAKKAAKGESQAKDAKKGGKSGKAEKGKKGKKGKDAEADAKTLVVSRHDERDQDAEPHDVQGDDRHHHPRDLAPLALIEGSL